MEHLDIAVIGGGLIGNAIAWRLARPGRAVAIFERGEPGVEASWAAAGLLQPEAGREAGPQLLGLWLASLKQYAAFVSEVREATKVMVEHRACGRLVVALNEGEEAALRARLNEQQAAGLACEWVSGDEAQRMEPALTREARAALYFPDHGLVDNRQLTSTVLQAAQQAGVQLHAYEAVVAIETRAGRVSGIRTTAGSYTADLVINAAGSWAAGLAPDLTGRPASPIVRPAKGEIIALQAQPRPIERVISISGGSVSARADGRLVVGATIKDAGFDRAITADGVARMLRTAVTAVPALREARFLEAWTGLRPRTPDSQPILGADVIEGLLWATGHYKMGILAAPATASIIADLVDGRAPAIPIDDLNPRRFPG